MPVVALALWGMATRATRLCPDRLRGTIAIGAALAILAWHGALAPLAVLGASGALGAVLLREPGSRTARPWRAPVTRRQAAIAWAVFVGLLVGLPLVEHATGHEGVAVFSRFYRTGSLVFGGGHVVLPLLEHEVVAPGWTTSERLLAGYGAAQAVPGPLFSLAACLGAVLRAPLGGLLLAALYDPVWKSAVLDARDFGLALAAFGALAFWKAPPWFLVLLTAVAAEGLSRFG